MKAHISACILIVILCMGILSTPHITHAQEERGFFASVYCTMISWVGMECDELEEEKETATNTNTTNTNTNTTRTPVVDRNADRATSTQTTQSQTPTQTPRTSTAQPTIIERITTPVTTIVQGITLDYFNNRIQELKEELALSSSNRSVSRNTFSKQTDNIHEDFTEADATLETTLLEVISTATTTLSGNSFNQNGNSFGTTATLGTTDNNALSLITNNISRLTVTKDGNVGVGTTTPVSKLTLTGIAGNGEVLDAITVATMGTGGSSMKFTNDNTGQGLMIGNQAHIDSDNYSYISAAGSESFSLRINAGINSSGNTGFLDLNRFGNDTAMVRMGTTTVEQDLYVTRNVGIGTTAPDAALTISGNSTSLPAVPTAGTNIHLGGANSGQLALVMDGFAAAPVITARRSQGTAAAPSAINFSGFNLFNIQTAGYGATAYSSPQNIFAVQSDGAWTDSSNPVRLTFNTTASGATTTTERMRIDSSGNVGIKTTTPYGPLHINVNNSATSIGPANSLIVENTDGTVGNISGIAFPQIMPGGTSLFGGGIYAHHLNRTSGTRVTDLAFYTLNNTQGERMRITGAGNVGIGTTSPSEKLQVAGNIKLGAHASVGNAILKPYSSGGLIIKPEFNINDNSSAVLEIQRWDDEPLVTFKEDGKIGVGTTIPDTMFHITSTLANNSILRFELNRDAIFAGDVIGGIHFEGQDSSASTRAGIYAKMLAISDAGNNDTSLAFFTASGSVGGAPGSGVDATTERMRITSTGNVGIGTTTPNELLHVSGSSAEKYGLSYAVPSLKIENISSSGSYNRSTALKLVSKEVGGTTRTAHIIGQGGNLLLSPDLNKTTPFVGIGYQNPDNVPSGTMFAISNDGTTARLAIDSSGNVGIGTSNPSSAKLQINGNIGSVGTRWDYDSVGVPTSYYGQVTQWGNTNGQDSLGGTQFLSQRSGATAGAAYFSFITQLGAATPVSRMVIDTSGNVGIGTTTPGAKLNILSTTEQLRLSYNSTRYLAGTVGSNSVTTLTFGGAGGGLVLDGESDTFVSNVLSLQGATGATKLLSTPNFYISSTGTPTVGTQGYFASPNSTIGDPNQIITGGGTGLGLQTSGSLFIATGGAARRVVVDTSGNVGIGTASPGYTLDVEGTAQFGVGTESTTLAVRGGNSHRRFAISRSNSDTTALYLGVSGNDGVLATNNSDMVFGKDYLGTFYEWARFEEVGDGTSDFNLGIGEVSPQRRLHVTTTADEAPVRFEDSSGYCEINPTSTTWTCTSDKRLKTNIQDLNSSSSLSNATTLERLSELRPVTFEWKNDNTHTERIGFIAQEVEEIFPDLVMTDADTGFKSVAYGSFTVYIIDAVRELAGQVKEMAQWFTGGKLTIQNDVCVDDVCVTKEQFKSLLEEAGGNTHTSAPAGNTSSSTNTNTNSTTSTTTPNQTATSTDPSNQTSTSTASTTPSTATSTTASSTSQTTPSDPTDTTDPVTPPPPPETPPEPTPPATPSDSQPETP